MRTSAHPRSRGEHVDALVRGSRTSGSSPLARGTLAEALQVPITWRLIPARAGNTPLSRASSVACSAHPRSRGEHLPTRTVLGGTAGSSPLARGTLRNIMRHPCFSRLIPARAGNTMASISSAGTPAAHPRSRGEHTDSRLPHPVAAGSSPLARGTPRPYRWACSPGRLIPARAGNTSQPAHCPHCQSAHPRSRGEHFCCAARYRESRGSSPLARGTR